MTYGSTTASDANGMRNELLELERRLLDPEVRHSLISVDRLLHPDFVEFGSGGRVYDKEMMVAMMTRETPAPVMIRDFGARILAEGVALVTYRTVGSEGREARRSSVWVREHGRWQLVFHQGTRIPSRLSLG
ncbi:MAG: DUF4440 domain-containing protein [Acidimicrobiia bacterium]